MKPPRLASLLLRVCASRRDRSFIVEDLAEEFVRRRSDAGDAAACRWYWRQVAGSVAPLLRDRLRGRRPSFSGRDYLATDAAQAMRSLVRHPGLALTIVLTLIVGLTTTLAATLLVHGIILRPLPYETPEQLVTVRPSGPRLPASVGAISLPDFDDWQTPMRSFAVLSGYAALTMTLTDLGEPRRIETLRVGPRFGELFSTTPVIGRDLEARDFVQGAQPVALLGHALWTRAFARDSGVVGRSLTLDGRRYEIVGVLPPVPFADVTENHELWIPLVARSGVAWEPVRGNGFISILARLAPGVTAAAAQDELSALTAVLAERYPRSNAEKPSAILEPLQQAIVKPVRRPLLLVFAAVGSVLLVACGNLVNLLLASAERRRPEFAVRMAVGAGRGRIHRQVALEVLACVGAALAVSLMAAPSLARLFAIVYPVPLPSTDALTLSTTTVVASLGLGLVVALVLAWPQLRSIRSTGGPAATGRVAGSRVDRRGRAALIASQVAFTLVLAFAGVALVRSMARLSAVEPGIDADGVVALSVSPSPGRFTSGAATRSFFEQLLQEVRQLPGVRAAAASTAVPFVNLGWGFTITPPEGGTPRMVRVTIASPGFFETLRVPLASGRLLSDAEHRSEQGVIVINTLTARLLPYDDPVGRTLRYSGIDWTIVGVVAPAVQVGLRTPASAELFLPWSQAGRAPQRLVVDIDGDAAAVLPLITARIRALDPAAPIAEVTALGDRITRSVAADRFSATLLSGLATVGVLLAALGIWSVTSYVVARGRRENGIRSALGESRARQLRRTIRGTLEPALAGVVIGAIICLSSAPALQTFLFKVPARDPLTLILAAAGVILTAVTAAAIPARLALRADAAAALRAE